MKHDHTHNAAAARLRHYAHSRIHDPYRAGILTADLLAHIHLVTAEEAAAIVARRRRHLTLCRKEQS